MRGEERVSVRNRQRKFKLDLSKIKKSAAMILEILGKEEAMVSLLFVNDAAIQKFNLQFRKINRPTDVLSFPGGAPLPGTTGEWLGDIVISVETAVRQAKQLGHSRDQEIRFLMIHGLLHLLGWDHERSPTEAKKMYELQRNLMSIFTKRKLTSEA